MKEIKIGSVGRAETIVKSSNLAVNMGSGSLEVFATPAMVALMEKSATNAVEEFLESGETSVGTAINISHVSATPLTVAVCATGVKSLSRYLQATARDLSEKAYINVSL